MEQEKNQANIRILCIQLKQLGDVLMTTAAIRELSEGIGNCDIDFLTQKPANLIYDNSPYVRYVYCVRWVASEFFSLMTRIRKQKYDVLIDFSGSSENGMVFVGHSDSKTNWISGAEKILVFYRSCADSHR